MTELKRLIPYLRPQLKVILLGLFLAIPLAALRMGPAPMVERIINDLFNNKDQSKLVLYPLLFIGLYILNFFIRFIHYYCNRTLIARVNQSLKQDLYDHLLSLSTNHFTEQSTGAILSRVGSDTKIINDGLYHINMLIREPVQIILCLGYAFYLNWKLALITCTMAPPLALIFSQTSRRVKRYALQQNQENANLFSTLQESLSGIRVIKLFQLEKLLSQRFKNQISLFTQHYLHSAVIEELSPPSVELISAFAIAFLLYFGGHEIIQGHMTTGELLAFFIAFALITNPIRTLNDTTIKLSAASAACVRVFEIFNWKSTIVEKSNPLSKSSFDQALVLNQVSFSYDPQRMILNQVSLTLKKGKTLALVGASGSGKSTLVQLLPRLYDVTSGSITIDGTDLRDLKISDLRQLISVVNQDVFLFNDSIYENIRWGRPDATENEVIAAAKLAHAYDFIQTLPEGMQTIIGDRGQKLSGGERQRVSIARAFLRSSPILILDEATSSLDSASERAVQSALEKLMQDRTTLVIAHLPPQGGRA
jgi:subfamily B ATP-binding cassette protein MsbA